MRDVSDGPWAFLAMDAEDPGYDDLVRAVGRVAVHSAELESMLRLFFGDLLDVEQAFALAEGETASWLVSNCKRLLSEGCKQREYLQANREQIDQLLRDCDEAFRERGPVIHAAWGAAGAYKPDSEFMARTSKRFKRPRTLEMSIADIDALADRFAGLAGLLLLVVARVPSMGRPTKDEPA